MTEKFVSPCPPPTPYERELLDILIEECSEVIQRATKMKRFGVLEIQTGQELRNTERLALEVGDLTHVLNLCMEEGLVPKFYIAEGIKNKRKQLAKYMQTTKETK